MCPSGAGHYYRRLSLSEAECLDGFEGDHQLFVGGHDDGLPGAVVGGDDAGLAEAVFVLRVVALDAEAGDAVEDGLAFRDGVFADAAEPSLWT